MSRITSSGSTHNNTTLQGFRFHPYGHNEAAIMSLSLGRSPSLGGERPIYDWCSRGLVAVQRAVGANATKEAMLEFAQDFVKEIPRQPNVTGFAIGAVVGERLFALTIGEMSDACFVDTESQGRIALGDKDPGQENPAEIYEFQCFYGAASLQFEDPASGNVAASITIGPLV